ncbi:anaphase-promoting complex subunit 2 [Tanacetum coccineum]
MQYVVELEQRLKGDVWQSDSSNFNRHLIICCLSSRLWKLELEFKNRTLQFTVTPVHAAIIMKFQEQTSWTSKSLAAARLTVETLQRRVNFWISKLTKAYQTANVLFEVLKAVNQTQAVKVDQEISTNGHKDFERSYTSRKSVASMRNRFWCDDKTVDITDYKDSDHEDGELPGLLIFSATNEFGSVCEQVVEILTLALQRKKRKFL